MKSGDLAISELMANPEGKEPAGEWIELYNTTANELVLNRMVLTVGGAGRTREHELRDAGVLPPGGYFVLGHDARATVDYVYGGQVELANSGGTVSLSCAAELIDEIRYGGEALEAGRSIGFDGGVVPSASANDDLGLWCADAAGGTAGMTNRGCGLARCRDRASDTLRDLVIPKAGDLVVSEIFADPEGEDKAREWVELYVAAEQAVDLNGVTLSVRPTGSTSSSSYVIGSPGCESAPAGSHVILSSSADKSTNGGVPVDVLIADLALPNGEPLELIVARGPELIDSAVVGSSLSGYAMGLDGALHAADANNTPANFCRASGESSPLFAGYGTPGDPNGLCGSISCRASGAVRRVRPPAPGDLVVTEVMAEPLGGLPEWLELYAHQAVDLNDIEVLTRKGTSDGVSQAQLTGEECLSVDAGTYLVLASRDDGALGARPFVMGDLRFSNGAALAIEVRHGEQLIDEASIPASLSGRSQSLASTSLDAAQNDGAASFCAADPPLGVTSLGTPGRPNLCGPTCEEAGSIRAVLAPTPRDLVITEILANPKGADAGRDWLELYVAASKAVDLNGITLVNETAIGGLRHWTIDRRECLGVAPGTYFVLSGPGAAEVLSPTATFGNLADTLLFSTFSGRAGLRVEVDGVAIDEVTYVPQRDGGASAALSPEFLAAEANDDPKGWCDGAGSTEPGSPNQANPPCAQ